MRKPQFALALAVLPLLATPAVRATEQTLRFDPAGTQVAFELPATGHDVHGAFALRSGELRFDATTGTASGQLVVDAASAKTGSDSRDKTMRNDVLETTRFPDFVFTAEKFEGTLAPTGESHITLRGKLTIHGTDHPLALPATVSVSGEALEARTQFSIPFVAWGMKDPSILFLRVEKEVSVKVTAKGRLEGAETAVAGLAGNR